MPLSASFPNELMADRGYREPGRQARPGSIQHRNTLPHYLAEPAPGQAHARLSHPFEPFQRRGEAAAG